MKKYLIIFSFTIMLGGCAIQPRTEKGSYVNESNAKELALTLERMARLCWEREWGWFGDGVRIESRRMIEGQYMIEAQRYAPDIGLQPPFVEIYVSEDSGKSQVKVFETGRNVFSGIDTLEPEIHTWVNGSKKCITKK